ncbi:MAG: NUDIX hydrolase N-terminal domain-containing protein, partial [Pseudomonadota bacterium]|nr:NUDIX hydrolase N-terminal domain-containing protein [Pseudomonadota bacterium]
TKDPYDAERFRSLQALAARIMAHHTGADARRIEALFAAEHGYATPKLDVRGAVWDRARQGHPPGLHSITKLFFVCALEGGAARASLETSESGWFSEDAIPPDLSSGRVLPRQIARMFAHWRQPDLPTEFD